MTAIWPQYASKPIEVYRNNPAAVRIKFIDNVGANINVTSWTSWTAVASAVSNVNAQPVLFILDLSSAAQGAVYLKLTGDQTLAMSSVSRGWNIYVRVNMGDGPTTILDGLLEITS